MNASKKHDPGRVRSAAVPMYDVTIIETQRGYRVICWIDTSHRPDIARLYQLPLHEVRATEGGTLHAYFMYDGDLFYLMIESTSPNMHDLSLPFSVKHYLPQLTFLCIHEASVLVEPGPEPQTGGEGELPIILSIPFLPHHRAELFSELVSWKERRNKLNS
jgi:hypothetical protein